MLVASVAGCGGRPAEQPQLTPKIEPPAIAKAGTLRVGVDLRYPPFAGEDDGKRAGLDVDIAAAVAAELGLKLETVDVPASEQATAVAEGDVDIMMSVPFTEEAMATMTLAGTYATNGPAFFIASESTETVAAAEMTLADLAGKRVAAQQASPSYWTLEYELGEGGVTGYPTLREALQALAAGETDVVVGDAMIAAYILRDIEGVAYAGQLEPGTELGIGLDPGNTELETAVREALDTLAADGILETVRTKWVGDLPELESGEATITP